MTKRVSNWTAALFSAAVAVTVVANPAIPAAAQQAESEGGQTKTEKGKVTYAQKCSHCHGPNMVNAGTVTPDLRGFPNDQTRFITTVKQGKNNRMPPWGDILGDDEIMDLWAYISSRRNP